MASDTKILFTDTNAFLQVRDLKDLPWRDLFPGVQAIDVMVAACVIEELDKHKTGTNQRRRDRARLALSLIEKASRESDLTLVLKDKPVRVRIVIARAPPFNWAAHPSLDPSRPDDRLVAEAISFGNGAMAFSHDTGPRIRARIANVQAHEPPAEWLLPLEQTDDQRKITKLERDLEQALSRTPKIVAAFDNIDEATFEIRVIRPVLQPLDPQVAHRLADQYLAKHPRASIAPTKHMLQLGGISEGQVQQYWEDYASFKGKVYDYYSKLHESVRRVGRAVAINYCVTNDSGVAAAGLRIEFDLEGDGSLLASREDVSRLIGSIEMPDPPKKPRPSPDYLKAMASNIPAVQPPRDPLAFYWVDRPGIGAKHSALQCQDFRATREFRDCVFVLPPDDLPLDLVLCLHISATNLPRPVNFSAKLTVFDQAVEWSDAVVQAILPDCIREWL
jgi:hypothetical protein